MAYGIQANVISLERGFEHMEGLKGIRIVSTAYNILIMADYVPIIGEVFGSVTFIANDGTARQYEKVHGFYRHSNNEFTFLIEGHLSADNITNKAKFNDAGTDS